MADLASIQSDGKPAPGRLRCRKGGMRRTTSYTSSRGKPTGPVSLSRQGHARDEGGRCLAGYCGAASESGLVAWLMWCRAHFLLITSIGSSRSSNGRARTYRKTDCGVRSITGDVEPAARARRENRESRRRRLSERKLAGGEELFLGGGLLQQASMGRRVPAPARIKVEFGRAKPVSDLPISRSFASRWRFWKPAIAGARTAAPLRCEK